MSTLYARVGVVAAIGAGPGPRNVLVVIPHACPVVVPRGNLRPVPAETMEARA